MISKLKPKRGEAGFTLLEILVAVVIIGILFALAAPVYAEQIKNGLKTSVTNDVKNVSGEMDNSWNEDEGYPLCFNQKLSDGNTANYYVNGVLVCSQAADANSPTTTGSTPSSTTGGGGSYTGGTGTGNSNGTGGTGGSTETGQPTTNRMLTWEEYLAANKFNSGLPFAIGGGIDAEGEGINNAAGFLGTNYAWNTPNGGWVFAYNYTASKVGSRSSLAATLTAACTTTRTGWDSFRSATVKRGETQYPANYNNNLCGLLMTGEQENIDGALDALTVYRVRPSVDSFDLGNLGNYNNINNGSLQTTAVKDYTYPSTGTYTILISKSPSSLFCSDYGSRDPFDPDNLSELPYQADTAYTHATPCSDGNPVAAPNLYDIQILRTGTNDTVSVGGLQMRVGGGLYSRTWGGRVCRNYPVTASLQYETFANDCDALYTGWGQYIYMSDDLPESWWNSYTTGGSGSGNDTNTDPSSTGSSGGSFAGQYVGSYFGEYCVEVTNKDLNKENGAGWQHYSSEDMKLKPGRCTA